MAEIATHAQLVQWAVETTPGVAPGSGFKKLASLSVEPGIDLPVKTFKPRGTKYITVAAPGREMTRAKIDGQPTYDELVYILSSVFTAATPVRNIPSTGLSYTWSFNPNSQGADSPKTFTVEQGDSTTRAHRFSYGLVDSFGYKLTESEFTVSGSMFGQRITDNITLTAGGTALDLVPILATEATVYLDNTAGGLGTTKLTRMVSTEFSIADKYVPVKVVDASQPSFVAYVEGDVKTTLKLMLAADAQGMALLDTLRTGATRFMRVEFVGSQIEAPTWNYKFSHDLALKVTGVDPWEDSDGMLAITWTFDVAHDGGWTKAHTASVVNKTASL